MVQRSEQLASWISCLTRGRWTHTPDPGRRLRSPPTTTELSSSRRSPRALGPVCRRRFRKFRPRCSRLFSARADCSRRMWGSGRSGSLAGGAPPGTAVWRRPDLMRCVKLAHAHPGGWRPPYVPSTQRRTSARAAVASSSSSPASAMCAPHLGSCSCCIYAALAMHGLDAPRLARQPHWLPSTVQLICSPRPRRPARQV